MTQLDDLLGQLKVDVPEAPTIDELRRRAGDRHRRLLSMVAILIGLAVVSAVLVQLVGDERTGEEGPADEHTVEWPTITSGPRSFEISVTAPANPLVRVNQFDLPRWDWISEDFETMEIKVDVTSTSARSVRLTPPTWERLNEDGVRYLGNVACNNYYVCLEDREPRTMARGDVLTFSLAFQPRLAAVGDYSFTTQLDYEVPSTGERGTISVDVGLRVWVPDPGTEPVPDPSSTIIWPPPSTTP